MVAELGGGSHRKGLQQVVQLVQHARNTTRRAILDGAANVSTIDKRLVPADRLKKSAMPVEVECQTGSMVADLDATFGRFDFKVVANPLENIVAIQDAEDSGVRVQYDSAWKSKDGAGYYKLSKDGRTAKVFKDPADGMPSIDITDMSPDDDLLFRNAVQEEVTDLEDVRATHVQTLRETIDESGLTDAQFKRAKHAYELKDRINVT